MPRKNADIKEAMAKKKLTNQKMAELVGCTYRQFYYYTNTKEMPENMKAYLFSIIDEYEYVNDEPLITKQEIKNINPKHMKRIKEVFRLRRLGLSFAEIGKLKNITRDQASYDYKIGLKLERLYFYNLERVEQEKEERYERNRAKERAKKEREEQKQQK